MTFYNPYSVVLEFEDEMKRYTGAPFAVAVDSCTSALFLSLKYHHLQLTKKWMKTETEFYGFHDGPASARVKPLTILKRTHISVPLSAIHAGFPIRWYDGPNINAAGTYRVGYVPVFDSALRLSRGLFSDMEVSLKSENPPGKDCFVCQSFQTRKHLPIGRGGMILHNVPEADEWFRRARFFGREEVPAADDPGPTILGWRCYMMPDEAARGLMLMQNIKDNYPNLKIKYPDLSKYEVFKPYVHSG